jgi:DNA processing protein
MEKSDRYPESASWLTLAYASGLKLGRVKAIVTAWCLEGEQPLAALFELSPAELTARLGISAEEADLVVAAADLIPEQATWLVQLERNGTQLITRADARYPRALVRWLPMALQPLLLFCQGDPQMLSRPSAVLVGAQDADEEMVSLARDLATLLAEEGLVVVSGLGKGVGQAAFDAALASEGGQAAAVLPMGIDTFRAIPGVPGEVSTSAEQGRALLLSPFHPQARFAEAHAIARNKLIVGLVDGLFVVAAAEGDVAYETADEALRLGKAVYVWDVDAAVGPAVAGNHSLIEAGALPIVSASDVLDAVEAVVATALEGMESAEPPPVSALPPATLVKDAEVPYDSQAVLDLLKRTGKVPDVLARRLREELEDSA